jgi:hypothetical protein
MNTCSKQRSELDTTGRDHGLRTVNIGQTTCAVKVATVVGGMTLYATMSVQQGYLDTAVQLHTWRCSGTAVDYANKGESGQGQAEGV